MATRRLWTAVLFAAASLAFGGPNTITYQGTVTNANGVAVPNDKYSMRFSIFPVAGGGAAIWQETDANVQFTDGIFSTTLGDGSAFGSLFASHSNLWLEVAIDLNKNGQFATTEIYAPRQKLNSAPWAMDSDTLDGRHAGNFWQLTGNPGITSGTHFVGTTDNRALDFRVKGARVLRLEPSADAPSVIGGHSANSIAGGTKGATIAGGGSASFPNSVGGSWGTIGGGQGNHAHDAASIGGGALNQAAAVGSTIGGGYFNAADEAFSTVGGGIANEASSGGAVVAGGVNNRALGLYGTVAGGRLNEARGENGTIGGGLRNTASGTSATIGGGSNNTASALAATIAGGHMNEAGNSYSFIGGGYNNTNDGDQATIGGGHSNYAGGQGATIAGGWANGAGGNAATIAGGQGNRAVEYGSAVGGGFQNSAEGDRATIAGGNLNSALGDYSAVSGGTGNTAYALGAFVGGGYSNYASGVYSTVAGGDDNTASGLRSTVGGGLSNLASGDRATIGGGNDNTAVGQAAAVGGGWVNVAAGNAATIAGGQENHTWSYGASIGGGQKNSATQELTTVGGGLENGATSWCATVAGGYQNVASGFCSFVAGGRGNEAAGYTCFAAGLRAKARHAGSFVWADSYNADFPSTNYCQFRVRASGGSYFYSNAGATVGVALYPGGASWSPMSDRNLKESFADVNGQDILERLAAIPVQTWNLKSQDPSIRHIGPMAQDFYAAFNVGEDNKHISTSDADGVALAAIQGLYKIVQEKDAEIATLRAETDAQVGAQQQQIAGLEARLAALEKVLTGSSPTR